MTTAQSIYDSSEVLRAVHCVLGGNPRIDLSNHPVRAHFEAGTLTLEGELASIAAKKTALRLAAALPAVIWVVDRLRVAPAERMTDDQIREHVRDALAGEPALSECALFEAVKGRIEVVRDPPEQHGKICIIVDDGVVTLEGELPSRAHKRLAGVLAWWVPGSRDVVDGLGVVPYEKDNDDELVDAVRLALEKDPFVEASQIKVFARDGLITLTGGVPTDAEKEMAEYDAWYVFGVGNVINAIQVQ